MATVEKIEKDIIRTKEKIAELQKKLRTLEMQRKEAESLEVKMDNATLTVFLKAYAKGDIELPEEYKAELEAASDTEVEETEDSEDEE